MRDSPKRAEAFSDLVEQMGGTVRGLVWTMGPMTWWRSIQAADDESAKPRKQKGGSWGCCRQRRLLCRFPRRNSGETIVSLPCGHRLSSSSRINCG